MNTKREQQRLYEALPQDARCFVRVCKTDDAMWISDLPRRTDDLAEIEKNLNQLGFQSRLDEKTCLWHLDWTEERWQKILSDLPTELPPFPKEERYHAAYALCRLWMLHPCTCTADQLPVVRRVIKLTAGPEAELLRAIPALHGLAASAVRNGIPGAYDAGRVLAGWLDERRKTK